MWLNLGDLIAQPFGDMSEQVPVLVHRTALHQHTVPDGGEGVLEPRSAVDNDNLGPRQPAIDEIIEYRAQASVLSPPMLLIASRTF